MFAEIKHIAIYTEQFDRSAEFYKSVLGMKQITSGMADENGYRDPKRGFLSDGVIELALLRRDAGDRSGLDHFGFQVEDSATAIERIRENFPDLIIRDSLAIVPFADKRVHDPLGVSFDVSQKRAIKEKASRYLPVYKEEGWDEPRQFNHLAIRVSRPDRCAKIFKKVFELSDVPSYTDEGICLTDGRSFLILRPCNATSYNTMRNGLEHIGFKVDDLDEVQKGLEEITKVFPLAASPKIDLPHRSFGEITRKFIDDCPFGKHALSDPNGVLIDIAE